MPKSESQYESLTAPSEADLWLKQKAAAVSSLSFVVDFLGLRMGSANDQVLTATAKDRLTDILRAVSIVESRHGTQGANQPARDPIQCGNPADVWWQELTGQTPRPNDRFIRGPGLNNLYADEVATNAQATAKFVAAASMSRLADTTRGHDDPAFAPSHSYLWGFIYLMHRINTGAGDQTYKCGTLGRDRLMDGAVAYNGNGDPAYRTKLVNALAEFNGLKTATMRIRVRTQASPHRKHKRPGSATKPYKSRKSRKATPTI